MKHIVVRFKLVTLSIMLLASASLALAGGWDLWGDITHPERILENIEREAGNVLSDIDRARIDLLAEIGVRHLQR